MVGDLLLNKSGPPRAGNLPNLPFLEILEGQARILCLPGAGCQDERLCRHCRGFLLSRISFCERERATRGREAIWIWQVVCSIGRLGQGHSLARGFEGNIVNEREAGIQDRGGHARRKIERVDRRRRHKVGDVKVSVAIDGRPEPRAGTEGSHQRLYFRSWRWRTRWQLAHKLMRFPSTSAPS